MGKPKYITINGYIIDANTIKDYYPCNIIGNFDNEDTKHTRIKFFDGFDGIYLIDYKVLFRFL